MDSSQKGLEEWSGTEGCLGTSLVCHDSKDATAIWLPRWLSGKESACQCSRCKRCRFYPWVRKIPWRKKPQPTSVFLLGKSHGQRSLVGYSPPGRGVRHNWADYYFLMCFYLLVILLLITQFSFFFPFSWSVFFSLIFLRTTFCFWHSVFSLRCM